MRSHIYRIFYNRISRWIFFIVVFLPCIDVLQLVLIKYQHQIVYDPAFAFFLVGSTRGHSTQILLLWFLPIYFLLMGADNAIQDYKTGYKNIIISKIGKKKYYLEKLWTSFGFSFFTIFSSLLLNFILVHIFLWNGTYNNGLNQIELPNNLLFTLSMHHPYLADFLFGIICCTMAGLSGVIGASFSLFFVDKKYSYAASFFVWFLLVLREHSLMFLFQPFAEYDFGVLVPIALIAVSLFLVIPIFIFMYEVKYNEN